MFFKTIRIMFNVMLIIGIIWGACLLIKQQVYGCLGLNADVEYNSKL